MTAPSPLFSVIIPTYNRPQALAACLGAIARSTLAPTDYEVIVVDDGSAVSLAPVVARFVSLLPVALLSQPHRGPGAARNAGAALARGRFLAFTDDDCLPAAAWLARLAKRFDGCANAAVGGRTLNALESNPYAAASQLLNHYLYDYYLVESRDGGFFATNNLALPRARFLALGGFDTGFPVPAAEDREFCNRWRCHGFDFLYAPEAVVCHAHDLTFPAFMRQHFIYGRGAHHYHHTRKVQQQTPVQLEPLAFYRNLFRYPFRQGGGRKAVGLSALLALAQTVYAIGYFGERIRAGGTTVGTRLAADG